MTTETSFCLASVRIIDGSGGPPIHGNVIIESGRIRDVGPAADPPGEAKSVIEGDDLTVLPGMVDAHVHLALNGSAASSSAAEPSDAYAVLRFAADMRKTLESGFTALRDLGGRNHIEMQLREAIDDGITIGPRLRLCGKIVSMTTPGTEFYPGMYREADGPDEVRKAAREQLKQGADVIKLMATGAGFSPGEDPKATQYSKAELRAAIEEAHNQGRLAAAHAEGIDGIRNAVESGIDTIEHGDYLIEDRAVAQEMADRGTFLVPTMNLYDAILTNPDPEAVPGFIRSNVRVLREANRASFQLAMELGVPIALGTDAGTAFNPHGGNARELELMVEAGMTAEQAIHAATGAGAEAIGLGSEVGTLEPGKLADLIVVRGNPADEISILARPSEFELVVKEGVVVGGAGVGAAQPVSGPVRA